ncbi:hypothetical protein AMATHDRAFT_142570 [Amanita thiersii Skay4041]|uniref:Ubiquitin-like-conjugating enzyme ATG10 n=1 Tax=Amanita thiersii Skay4041 TaxID=703135 RepID=A0A2A9NUJ0_9AGAR|nr:hypothetical protein AMATHDRAFT_142570 [Amanita thiersii Skay4041]
MFSRSQFDTACKAYVSKHNKWTWHEHSTFPGFGYMSRTTIQTMRSPINCLDEQLEGSSALDNIDEATAPIGIDVLTSQQYVIFSATFQVPTFYFTVHDAKGVPLSLYDILRSTLFRRFAFTGVERSNHALTLPGSSFPLLSQGDHPTLGTPCWYLHPCATAKAVGELMAEQQGKMEEEEEILLKTLETWVLVVRQVVDWGRE